MRNCSRLTLQSRLLFALSAAALACSAALAANWFTSQPTDAPMAADPMGVPPSSQPLPPELFRGWPTDRKPDVAIILSGQQHSYLKFCGCSSPQLGGFERRFNFLTKLREKGWPLVAFDLGDLVQRKQGSVHDQTLLKYETAMKALEAIGYAAIGLGENDYNLPLLEGLSRFTLQKPDAFPRVLAANLQERLQKFPVDDKRSMIGDWLAAGGKNGVPKIGVVSLAGRAVTERIENPDVKFEDNGKILPGVLAQMDAEKVELKVLLYHGNIDQARILAGDPKLARNIPLTFPDKFDLILCLSEEEEPPARPEIVGKTMIVRIGHRGRHVGVVGVFRSAQPGKPFELFYQFAAMGEEYETDKDKESDHRILKLLDTYAKEVRDQNFISRTPQIVHPAQATFPQSRVAFVGSSACQGCHQSEYTIWANTKHSHAYEALTKYAKKPALRQFDPECIVCHSVGYGFQTGYSDEKKTPHLKNVGCENCHGPGSMHVAEPRNPKFYGALSPWKAQSTDLLPKPDALAKGLDALPASQKELLLRVDGQCQKCHDTDNDPHYKFEKYWPVISHGKGGGPTQKKVIR